MGISVSYYFLQSAILNPKQWEEDKDEAKAADEVEVKAKNKNQIVVEVNLKWLHLSGQ
jgi:hypothetical protein